MSEARKLNLAERRAISSYQETVFADKVQQIKAAVGADFELDVNWESMAGEGQADRYGHDDYWTNIFFNPVLKALADVAADAMGKEALQDGLKRISFYYDEATAPVMSYENGVKFADGNLSINFKPFSNADAIEDRAIAIVKALEAGL